MGATGPEGPQGPEGPIGATGPQGPQGDPGVSGSSLIKLASNSVFIKLYSKGDVYMGGGGNGLFGSWNDDFWNYSGLPGVFDGVISQIDTQYGMKLPTDVDLTKGIDVDYTISNLDPGNLNYDGNGEVNGSILMAIAKCEALQPDETLTNVDGAKTQWKIISPKETICGKITFNFNNFINAGIELEKGDYVFLGWANDSSGDILYTNFNWVISYTEKI